MFFLAIDTGRECNLKIPTDFQSAVMHGTRECREVSPEIAKTSD